MTTLDSITLLTSPLIDIFLALFIAILMPASLYLTGFWVQIDRNDVRVVVRNTFVVLIAMFTSLLLIILITTNSTTPISTSLDQIELAMRYLGLNIVSDCIIILKTMSTGTLGNITTIPTTMMLDTISTPKTITPLTRLIQTMLLESIYIFIGFFIVNLLFLGSIFHNIIEFVLSRNRQRSYAVSMLQYHQQRRELLERQQQQQQQPLIKSEQSTFNTLPYFPRYQVDSFWSVCQYELKHFTDHIQGSEILPISLSPLSLFNLLSTTVSAYYQDCDQAFSHYLTSRSYTHHGQVTQFIEYERVTNLRSILLVPVVEETIYRGALYPLIFHYFQETGEDPRGGIIALLFPTIFTSAMIFASCHLHHFFRHLNQQRSIPKALLIVSIQWLYCFLFSLFGGYLYSLPLTISTSPSIIFSLPTAIVAHMVCNIYGLPNFDFFVDQRSILRELRWSILLVYLLGVSLFISTLLYLPTFAITVR